MIPQYAIELLNSGGVEQVREDGSRQLDICLIRGCKYCEGTRARGGSGELAAVSAVTRVKNRE